MSFNNYPVSAGSANLTEAQLFRRFLDAPVRTNPMSTLIAPVDDTWGSMEYEFCTHMMCESNCLPIDEDHIVEILRDCDDPEGAIKAAISDLEYLLGGFKMLEREFDILKKATRTKPPEDDEDDAAYDQWADNPRYALPVAEENVEAAVATVK